MTAAYDLAAKAGQRAYYTDGTVRSVPLDLLLAIRTPRGWRLVVDPRLLAYASALRCVVQEHLHAPGPMLAEALSTALLDHKKETRP